MFLVTVQKNSHFLSIQLSKEGGDYLCYFCCVLEAIDEKGYAQLFKMAPKKFSV